jgi:hypothetical protein
MTYNVGDVFVHRDNPQLVATITRVWKNTGDITVDWVSPHGKWNGLFYSLLEFKDRTLPQKSLEEQIKELLG